MAMNLLSVMVRTHHQILLHSNSLVTTPVLESITLNVHLTEAHLRSAQLQYNLLLKISRMVLIPLKYCLWIILQTKIPPLHHLTGTLIPYHLLQVSILPLMVTTELLLTEAALNPMQ